MVKTSFTDRSENFGSKWSTKGKISRPKADTGEVRRFKQGFYAVKEIYFHLKWVPNKLPQQVYIGLKI